MELTWALVLIGLLLLALELFVPGGVLAVVGLLCFLGAVIGVWSDYGTTWGLVALASAIAACVAMVIVEVTLLRHGPLARYFLLNNTSPGTANTKTPVEADVLNRTGETLTTLAPSGVVRVEGKNYEAMSQDGLLEKGTPVVVVGRDAFRVVVRRA